MARYFYKRAYIYGTMDDSPGCYMFLFADRN